MDVRYSGTPSSLKPSDFQNSFTMNDNKTTEVYCLLYRLCIYVQGNEWNVSDEMVACTEKVAFADILNKWNICW